MLFVAMPYIEGYFSDETELSACLALANVTIVGNKFPQPIEVLLAEASLLDQAALTERGDALTRWDDDQAQINIIVIIALLVLLIRESLS